MEAFDADAMINDSTLLGHYFALPIVASYQPRHYEVS